MTDLFAQRLHDATPKLRRYFAARGLREEAEDLAAEVALKAVAARAKYDPVKPLLPWLLTIAHRVRVDFWRERYGRMPTVEEPKPMLGHNGGPPLDEDEEEIHTGCEPGKLRAHERCNSKEQHTFELEIERRERHEVRERLFAILTPDERRSFELFAEGLAYGDVA